MVQAALHAASDTTAVNAVVDGETSPLMHHRGWRSRGWIPLAYPKSALLASNSVCFPLHSTVMKAAVRELLILDGTLDATTLTVTTEESTHYMGCKGAQDAIENETQKRRDETDVFTMGARYLGHLEPERYTVAPEELVLKLQKEVAKRKRKTDEERAEMATKKIKTETSAVPVLVVSSTVSAVQVIAGESVVDTIVQRTLATKRSRSNVDVATTAPVEEESVESRKEAEVLPQNVLSILVSRPPRKVSDLDHVATSNQAPDSLPATLITEQTVGPRDISRFARLSETAANGSFVLKRNDLPALLEASIATEATLRSISYQMSIDLCETFTNQTLRLFLGYKTPTLARDRLLAVFSDFLFDTSHAQFAWQQTERELAASTSTTSPSAVTSTDKDICSSLFDSRALRKIGGFETSSLLPAAISIQRLAERKTTWKTFAATLPGKEMLQHHQSMEECMSVGLRRRGQRLRHRQWSAGSASEAGADKSLPSATAEDGSNGSKSEQRSRSSSFASLDTNETPSATDETPVPFFAEIPSACDVRLVRKRGTSWGVLLSKEGEMCVVVRGSKSPTRTLGAGAELRSGDLILHVENERGEVALSPSFYSTQGKSTKNQQEWFRSIVDLFKTSQELSIIIQRVGTN